MGMRNCFIIGGRTKTSLLKQSWLWFSPRHPHTLIFSLIFLFLLVSQDFCAPELLAWVSVAP